MSADESGLFSENGPYRFASNGSIILNEHSWNNHATILYVDQPGMSIINMYFIIQI